MDSTLEQLLDRIQAEARREDFPIDRAVYEAAGKDPIRPILCAGALDAPVCIVGRDLGKDEVRLEQPLVGAGGSLVRLGILQARGLPEPPRADKEAQKAALRFVLLTNLVPYKPPGNKAYTETVRERFRPFVTELLNHFWTGLHIITLGSEAFRWFAPYGEEETFETIGRTDERFESSFPVTLPNFGGSGRHRSDREVQVLPLPHPSPLNRRWTALFPRMLQSRLREIQRTQGIKPHSGGP